MKHLMLFSTGRLDEMLNKGNVWYIKHYERYFDKVTMVYLTGHYPDSLFNGNTELISVGTNQYLLDLIFAPFRLWRIVRRLKPSTLLTADILYSWWTTILIRIFLHKKINLMPVCNVHTIYPAHVGYFLPWLPRWLERLMLDASFWTAHKIILSLKYQELSDFFLKRNFTKMKVKLLDVLVEEFPTIEFYENINKKFAYPKQLPSDKTPILLSVARLYSDKILIDILDTVAILNELNVKANLVFIGEGPLKTQLEVHANSLGIKKQISFLGAVPNGQLVAFYQHATLVITTCTGTSLREAALCGAPIVSYRNVVVNGILEEGKTAYLTEVNTPESLALKVKLALEDEKKRNEIGENGRVAAQNIWGVHRLTDSLRVAFGS